MIAAFACKGAECVVWHAPRVSVLDGGFPAWVAEGFPVATEEVSSEEVDAAAVAARSPNPSGSYPAKLQVCE